MCRSIKPLYNFDPPASKDEIIMASTQFVKKLSGFPKPSKENEKAYTDAINSIAGDVEKLFASLSTHAKPRNRDIEARKKRALAQKRFGVQYES